MKVLLDTSVLVAASVREHPHFERADAVLRRCNRREEQGHIVAHALLEFHATLSCLPRGLAVPPHAIGAILDRGILPHVKVLAVDAEGYLEVQRRAGASGLISGIVYDLLPVATAEAHGMERVYTFNEAEFRRVARPDFQSRIVVP